MERRPPVTLLRFRDELLFFAVRGVDALLRRFVSVAVRRPPRRFLEVEPTFVSWPRDDEPWRLRLADFIRLVAIAQLLSASE